jgi:hypothetical protein
MRMGLLINGNENRLAIAFDQPRSSTKKSSDGFETSDWP